MNRQLTLFTETTHLEPDHWFSGTPDIPDPYDGEHWTYNAESPIHIGKQAVLFHGELAYNGELVSELGKVAVDGE